MAAKSRETVAWVAASPASASAVANSSWVRTEPAFRSWVSKWRRASLGIDARLCIQVQNYARASLGRFRLSYEQQFVVNNNLAIVFCRISQGDRRRGAYPTECPCTLVRPSTGANSAAIKQPACAGLSKWLCTMMASVSGSPCKRAPRVRQPNTSAAGGGPLSCWASSSITKSSQAASESRKWKRTVDPTRGGVPQTSCPFSGRTPRVHAPENRLGPADACVRRSQCPAANHL